MTDEHPCHRAPELRGRSAASPATARRTELAGRILRSCPTGRELLALAAMVDGVSTDNVQGAGMEARISWVHAGLLVHHAVQCGVFDGLEAAVTWVETQLGSGA